VAVDTVDVLTLDDSSDGTLEERLERLEDRAAIRDLIMRYGWLCDQRRWDDLLELYTDDVERELAGTLDERVEGKEALRELLVAPALPRKSSSDPGAPPVDRILELELKHMIATEVVKILPGGDEAVAQVYYTMVVTRGQGEEFQRGVHDGTYEFHFVKRDGRWLFRRQIIASNNATNPLFQAVAEED
jgi:hypothetical protein